MVNKSLGNLSVMTARTRPCGDLGAAVNANPSTPSGAVVAWLKGSGISMTVREVT